MNRFVLNNSMSIDVGTKGFGYTGTRTIIDSPHCRKLIMRIFPSHLPSVMNMSE